jgi:hypothetical protein
MLDCRIELVGPKLKLNVEKNQKKGKKMRK